MGMSHCEIPNRQNDARGLARLGISHAMRLGDVIELRGGQVAYIFYAEVASVQTHFYGQCGEMPTTFLSASFWSPCDVINCLLHRLNRIRLLIGNLNGELLLDGHDNFDCI